MGKEENRKTDQEELESMNKKDFNAGGNDSDYDGGHPQDVSPQSGNQINSSEERLNREEASRSEDAANSFNAGGNDSDYDGGHPDDVSSDSKGSVSSEHSNTKED
ncbi:hypothetical protein [Planomicrobium sp. CPCC 101079]|uniref:hypothetical protein n=1 Tax=Planomicrobium sp. CPCC 101079 TaxID=2599618 RepID=UPI0011B69AF1|nr:hypothetical protein [Planomicrobium sp. CPCC 101079]TWT16049.1 hypothetical protein FQV28_00295 [Planomicrobium sp. CPCC 101079]